MHPNPRKKTSIKAKLARYTEMRQLEKHLLNEATLAEFWIFTDIFTQTLGPGCGRQRGK